MYTAPFIPRRDDLFQLWAQAFCHGIDRDPARFGMTAAESADLVRKCSEFNATFLVAVTPGTRTSGTIVAKQDARSILESSCRDYAGFIRLNKGIPDQDKIDIGVRPRNVAHQRRRCPGSFPLLNITRSIPGLDELCFRDSNTPDSRAKPNGAERIEIWVAYTIAGEPQPKVSDARFLGSYKKNPIIVARDPEEEARGARPTWWARWAGFDGGVGPWSLPVSLASAIIAGARAHAAKAKPDEDQPIQAPRLAA